MIARNGRKTRLRQQRGHGTQLAQYTDVSLPPRRLARTVLPRRPRAGQAGFTLLELLIVVIMVGVLAALAIPAISTQMRDRRNNQAAHELAMLYRQARAQAVGRGSAVMVRFNATGQGSIEVREAQTVATSGACVAQLPAPSCTTNWTAGSNTNRFVSRFDPSTLGAYSNVQLAFFLANGIAAGGVVDICFTPLGRPYRRLDATSAFDVMNEVPYVTVTPLDGAGITRRVLIVPTGATRLAL